MTEPTDAEIWQMWMPMVRRMGVADPVDFARAVLAKWGSPVVAGEPQPSTEGPPELWLQLHGDCAEPELSEPVDYTAGDVTWCWHSIHDSDVRYVRADLATTPQPTQAQAGAVPLTDEQIDQAIAELGLNYLADAHATNRAVLRKLCHHAHDIKGGQHGADT